MTRFELRTGDELPMYRKGQKKCWPFFHKWSPWYSSNAPLGFPDAPPVGAQRFCEKCPAYQVRNGGMR